VRAFLSFGAQRHRTILIASGAMLAALLMLATTPRHSAGQGNAIAAIHAPLLAAGKAAAGKVTGDAGSALSAIPTNTGFHGALAKPAAAPVGITAHLPAGQRAFSLRVGEDDIVGGFLQSGDQVDVLATIPGAVFPQEDAAKHPDRSSTVLLLQNIHVLAVGNSLTAGPVQADARTVSLALAPEQLVRLSLAVRLGKVSLAVRRPGDDGVSATATATLTDLLPIEHAAPPVAAPRASVSAASAGPHIPFLAGTRITAMGRDQ
jgi:Flp pilus assembly protein CpaB